jgi:hypothetical protein
MLLDAVLADVHWRGWTALATPEIILELCAEDPTDSASDQREQASQKQRPKDRHRTAQAAQFRPRYDAHGYNKDRQIAPHDQDCCARALADRAPFGITRA